MKKDLASITEVQKRIELNDEQKRLDTLLKSLTQGEAIDQMLKVFNQYVKTLKQYGPRTAEGFEVIKDEIELISTSRLTRTQTLLGVLAIERAVGAPVFCFEYTGLPYHVMIEKYLYSKVYPDIKINIKRK